MNIIGGKVILRAIESKDAELLHDLINDPETEFMVLSWSFPVSMQEHNEWINSLKKFGEYFKMHHSGYQQ